MAYTGILGEAGIAKEVTPGTFVAPTNFLRFIPPFQFSTDIDLLEGQGVEGLPDAVRKVAQGAGQLKSGKFKTEVEPENIGEHLMAIFGTDTKTGPTNTSVYTHAFTRAATATPPTYSWWMKPAGTLTYPQFAGCMLSKLDFSMKAKEFLIADAEWKGLKYVSGGSTQSVSYSALNPFKFDQAVLKIPGGGSQNLNYDDLKITFDNMVEVVHSLQSSIYGAKVYSKGFKVTVNASVIVEDVTEWTNFINGTTSSLNVAFTSTQNIPSSSPNTPYSLTFDIPTLAYSAAPFPIAKDLIKIAFTGSAVYSVGSSYTAKATLVNSISTTY